MKKYYLRLLALGFFFFPQFTLAHPGHDMKDFGHDIKHFITDPYHLSGIGLMAFGVWIIGSTSRKAKLTGVFSLLTGIFMISFA